MEVTCEPTGLPVFALSGKSWDGSARVIFSIGLIEAEGEQAYEQILGPPTNQFLLKNSAAGKWMAQEPAHAGKGDATDRSAILGSGLRS